MGFTVDEDDETGTWKVTKRDEDNMPLDEWGPYETKAQAGRSASNRRYAAKTRRPVVKK